MTKPVILTGLRANNNLTIGNYFGGMLPIIEMAKARSDEYQINMFIPDLHSFTTPIDHSQLQDQIMHNARLFAAAGLPLDNDSIHLYRQSYIPAHSELTWVLNCFTGFGQLRRMTQFKDKTGTRELLYEAEKKLLEYKQHLKALESVGEYNQQVEAEHNLFMTLTSAVDILGIIETKQSNVSTGLFTYPVLMAADILLYNAKYIPVGEDQTQHLEFTRDIAERMNSKFGFILEVPEEVKKQHEFFGKGQGLRIKDLQNPSKKMSKSDEHGKGVIFLTDEPSVAAKKVMSATTDDKASVNYDPENQPGISNLLQILSLLRGQSLDDTEAEFKGMERYGDFKKVVADEIRAFLTEFQNNLSNVSDQSIIEKLQKSEQEMNTQANATLYRVQQAVGLRPKES